METNVNYPTDLHMFDCIRYAILENIYSMSKKIRGNSSLMRRILKASAREIMAVETKNILIVFGILG